MSGGHLCKAEVPTEAAAETVDCVSRDGRREKLKVYKILPFCTSDIYHLISNI